MLVPSPPCRFPIFALPFFSLITALRRGHMSSVWLVAMRFGRNLAVGSIMDSCSRRCSMPSGEMMGPNPQPLPSPHVSIFISLLSSSNPSSLFCYYSHSAHWCSSPPTQELNPISHDFPSLPVIYIRFQQNDCPVLRVQVYTRCWDYLASEMCWFIWSSQSNVRDREVNTSP